MIVLIKMFPPFLVFFVLGVTQFNLWHVNLGECER
jgi:hypothetical protein